MIRTGEGETLLCLSGGGFRMLECGCGVMQALEEAGIHVNKYMGSSAGGILAGLHASGMSGKDIEELIRRYKASDLIDFNWGMFIPFHKSAVYNRDGMRRVIADNIIEAMTTRCVTVTATKIYCDRPVSVEMPGKLDSIMATSAMPEIFDSEIIDCIEYSDGGVLNNIPLPKVINLPKYANIIVVMCNDGTEKPLTSAFKATRAISWYSDTMLREFTSVMEEYTGVPNMTLIWPDPFPSSLLDWSKDHSLIAYAKDFAKKLL